MSRAVAGRFIGGVRLIWAVALLIFPERIIVASGGEDTSTSRLIGRALGARHLTQALVEVSLWPRARRIGRFVDAAHAFSAALFAAFVPRWRKCAMRDALIAASFSLLGIGRDRRSATCRLAGRTSKEAM
jgi:hypothetical protein